METKERARLRIVSYCHLKPVTVLMNPLWQSMDAVFPAAKAGFDKDHTRIPVFYTGAKLALVDISGLTHLEVKMRMKEDHGAEVFVQLVRLLQAFEFLDGEYGYSHQGLSFNQIVAYQPPDTVTVAKPRPGGGFVRVDREDLMVPWEEGTVGLFFIDEL